MKQLLKGLSVLMSRMDSIWILISSTVLFLLLLLAAQNGTAAISVLGFDTISLLPRITLSLSTFFDIQNTFTTSTLILAVLGSFLGGLNIALAYTYIRIRGEIILRSGLYSGVGLFLAFLGIGCAACGTAFLSVILGFFGFSAMLQMLPYKGEEIGYIGLIILLIATYVLAKKLDVPNVC